MNKQARNSQQHEKIELRLYSIGLIMLAALWVLSFFFSGFVSPQRLLETQLSLNGIAVLYFLSIYFFQSRLVKKEQQPNIIILFNGRELERR
ncbi:hypothetical protein [Sutcliffiella deserti]|uniref:hypothetical protein n=1 Tax=Sutcliffiella deserti TaxID=2875501 RepID=UPI001CBD7B98|nr:hypothetical protein [Sutcliffiella deserti]